MNKCNDCGNEWKIEKAEYPDIYNDFDNYNSSKPSILYYTVRDYIEMEYDPKDVTEEYNSLDEKREAYCEKERKNRDWSLYRTLPKYMLDYALFKGIDYCLYDKEKAMEDEIWGVSKDSNRYSYQMPDELWKIVKSIIGWNGVEE